jgi:hypothetical protein
MSYFGGELMTDEDRISQKAKKRHRSEDECSMKKRLKLENGSFLVEDKSSPLTDVIGSDISVEITSEKRRRHKSRSKAGDMTVSQVNDDSLLTTAKGLKEVELLPVAVEACDTLGVDVPDTKHHRRHKKHRHHSVEIEGDTVGNIITITDMPDPVDYRNHKEECRYIMDGDEDVVTIVDIPEESKIRKRHRKKNRRVTDDGGDVIMHGDVLQDNVSIVEPPNNREGIECHFLKNPIKGGTILVSDADDIAIVDTPDCNLGSSRRKKKRHHTVESGNDGILQSSVDYITVVDDVASFVETPTNYAVESKHERRRHKRKHHHVSEIGDDHCRLANDTALDVSVIDIDVPDTKHHQETVQKVVEKSEPEEACVKHKHRSKHHQSHLYSGGASHSGEGVATLKVDSQPMLPVLLPTESLRFKPPKNFVDVEPSASQLFWEDVVGHPDKELWLIRAPSDCTASDLDHCEAAVASTVTYKHLQVDIQPVETSSSSGLVVILPSRQDKKFHIASAVRGLVMVTRNTVRSLPESVSHKKKKRHKEQRENH